MAPLNDLQFVYDQPELGESRTLHRLRAFAGPTRTQAGEMIWQSGGRRPGVIRNIMTSPGLERRGVATALWNEGHRMAVQNRSIPRPAHSTERTRAGDAWARAVGGRLPRRSR